MLKRLGGYFLFTGRATRLEYWLLGIGQWVVIFAIVQITSRFLGHNPDETGVSKFEDVSLPGQIISAVAFVVLGWMSICVEVQRWHDRGKSGWWFWLFMVPLIGPIWTLVELGFRRGTRGPNAYGPDPLAKD